MSTIAPDELARYLAGELSEEESRRLAASLEADPSLRRRLEGIADQTNGDAEQMLRRLSDIEQRKQADRPPSHPARRGKTARRAWIAAVAATAVFAILMVMRGGQELSFATAAGETERVQLPDGSEVVLNAMSRLVVDAGFDEAVRAVRLEGEAYFDVAADAARPFVITTELAEVAVLGTSFNVEAYADDDMTVVVKTGRVAVRPDEGVEAELGPGDRADVVAGEARIALSRVSVDDALAWTEGRLLFRGVPLAEVARRLERHFGVHVEVPPEAADNRLDASFEAASIERVASLIAAALDLDVSIDADTVAFRTSGGER